MAQKVTTTLVDDISGEIADDTVMFGLDGASYEIDLTAVRAADLRDMLSKYAYVARRVKGSTQKTSSVVLPAGLVPTRTAADRTAARERLQKIRDWARANGYSVSDRGRISAEIMEGYRTGTPAPASVAPEPADPVSTTTAALFSG